MTSNVLPFKPPPVEGAIPYRFNLRLVCKDEADEVIPAHDFGWLDNGLYLAVFDHNNLPIEENEPSPPHRYVAAAKIVEMFVTRYEEEEE